MADKKSAASINRRVFISIAGISAAGALAFLIDKWTLNQAIDFAKNGPIGKTPQFEKFATTHAEHIRLTKNVGFTISSLENGDIGVGSCVVLRKNIFVHSAHQIHNAATLLTRFVVSPNKAINLVTKPKFYDTNRDTAFSILEGDEAEKAERAGIQPVTFGKAEARYMRGTPVFAVGFLPGSLLNVVGGAMEGYLSQTTIDGEVKSCKLVMTEKLYTENPVAPGMSGGLVADEYGNAVGIITATAKPLADPNSDVSFFTPIDDIMDDCDALFPNSIIAPSPEMRSGPRECRGTYQKYTL